MFPQYRSLAVLSLCLFGLVLLVSNRVHAASGTWSQTTSGGNWTVAGNWQSNQIASGSGFTANFNNINITGVFTVNLNGDRTIGNLNFGDTTPSSAQWILTGNTLTLAGGTPTVDTTGATGRISSNLIAASGFTKTGSGNFVISGASNNIDGTVLINAGVVAFGAATAGAGTDGAAFDLAVSGTQITVSTEGAGVGQIFQMGSLTGVAGTTLRNAGTITGTNTFAIGALGTDTEFAGNVNDADFDTTTTITKVGAGTLTLSGSNNYTGITTLSGGVLSVSTLANGGASSGIGASSNAAANLVFDGGTLRYTGASVSTNRNFTLIAGKVGVWDVSEVGTKLTVSGASTATSGGLTKVGLGTLELTGANLHSGATLVNAGTLLVNGSLSNSSAVQVGASGTLGGHGSMGAISGAGTVAPGNSPGILTALSVDGTSGLDFYMELTALAPVYGNAANSLNDVLRLTAGTPFVTALDADNTVTIDFSSLSLAIGQTYYGGFYADAGDFASSISGANFVFAGADGFTITVSTVQQTANFGSGNVNGWVTQFDVLAIPEPSTTLLLTAGLMVTLFLRRRSPKTN